MLFAFLGVITRLRSVIVVPLPVVGELYEVKALVLTTNNCATDPGLITDVPGEIIIDPADLDLIDLQLIWLIV
jgi:hypothetical protein